MFVKEYTPKNHNNLKIIEPTDDSISSKNHTKASITNSFALSR